MRFVFRSFCSFSIPGDIANADLFDSHEDRDVQATFTRFTFGDNFGRFAHSEGELEIVRRRRSTSYDFNVYIVRYLFTLAIRPRMTTKS